MFMWFFFFFSSRRRHTRLQGDWSSDVCSSDLTEGPGSLHRGLPADRAFARLGLTFLGASRRQIGNLVAHSTPLSLPHISLSVGPLRRRVISTRPRRDMVPTEHGSQSSATAWRMASLT